MRVTCCDGECCVVYDSCAIRFFRSVEYATFAAPVRDDRVCTTSTVLLQHLADQRAPVRTGLALSPAEAQPSVVALQSSGVAESECHQ